MNLEAICDQLADIGAYLTGDSQTIDSQAVAVPLFTGQPAAGSSTSCYAVCEPLPEHHSNQHSGLPCRPALSVSFVRHCNIEDRIIDQHIHTVTTSPSLAETAMRHLVSAHTAGGVLDTGDPQLRNEASRRRLLADYLETLSREVTWRSMHTLPARLRAAARTLERRAARWEPQYRNITQPDRRPDADRRAADLAAQR